jgi:hypothetical protein
MIEVSEVRKRLRQTIDAARREATGRRARHAEVSAAYNRFLDTIAVPVFRMFAIALKAEGYPFTIETPQGSVRLARDPSGDFVEIELDATRTPPAAIGRSRVTLGRSVTTLEEPVREGASVADLTDVDVVEFVLRHLRPFVER